MFKKLISTISIIALSISVLTGCSNQNEVNNEESIKEVKVVMPDGLPTMAISKLANENPTIKDGYNITYSLEKTPETLSTSVMKEEADIAIVPSNMAAIAYNKTSNYKIAGTVGEGSFYLVSTKDLKEFEDLIGEEVYNTGKGLTPDIIVKKILSNNEIKDSDINFSYVNSTTELIPLLASGKANTGFVSEPALTTLISKNPNIKIIKGLNDEWKKLNNSDLGYPQSTLIVKSSFLNENEEFVKLFLEELNKSVDWANENPIETGTYAQEIGASIQPTGLDIAIKRSNLKFTPINTDNESIADYDNYYKILYDFDNKSVGGKIPDGEIYFIQE